MKKFAGMWMLLAVLLCGIASAQEQEGKDVNWRTRGEIARRGTLVERIGSEGDSTEVDETIRAITAAAELPPDDSHKWFVSILVKRNDPESDKLRADFANSEVLKAWVDTKDYQKSWAHFQIFDMDDRSQAYRWRGGRPNAFVPQRLPAIIVQPPLNGSWGRPEVMVFCQQGYDGPENLDRGMRAWVQAFAAKKFSVYQEWQRNKGATVTQDGAVHPGMSAKEVIEKFMPPVAPDKGSTKAVVTVGDKAGKAEADKGSTEQAAAPMEATEGPAPFGPYSPLPNVSPQPATPNQPVTPILPNGPLTPNTDKMPVWDAAKALFNFLLPSGQTTSNFLLLVVAIVTLLHWLAPRTKTTLDDRLVAVLDRFVPGPNQTPTTPASPNQTPAPAGPSVTNPAP